MMSPGLEQLHAVGPTAYDLDGHPRTWNSTVDLGVYERGDEIFADGYE